MEILKIIVKSIFIAIYAVAAIGYVLLIGEERKPITKKGAVLGVILSLVMISGILYI